MAHHLALAGHFHQRRGDVVGVLVGIGQLTLSAEHLTTLVAGLDQGVLHGLEGLLVDQRADQVALQRVADAHLGVGGLEAADDLVLDRLVGDQAAQGGAALAGGADGAEQDGAHGHVQIGAGRQDHGVVAAELEDAATEAGGDARGDFAAHAGAAGGADQHHARVGHQGFAGVAVADDQLAEAGRGVAEGLERLVEQRLAGEGGQRGLLRRLPHHGVAADQRQGGVPRPHGDREVEGADHADHAQRVPGLAHVVARALGGDGQAVQLARQADGEVADVDHFLHFAQAFLGDLAGFPGHQLGQLGLVGAQHFAEQAHQFAAARRRYAAPGLEGLLGGGNPSRDAAGRLQRHGADAAAVDGAVDDVGALAGGLGADAQTAEKMVDHG
ncbi:hypothetical protein D3C78_794970 [compost metagenome]